MFNCIVMQIDRDSCELHCFLTLNVYKHCAHLLISEFHPFFFREIVVGNFTYTCSRNFWNAPFFYHWNLCAQLCAHMFAQCLNCTVFLPLKLLCATLRRFSLKIVRALDRLMSKLHRIPSLESLRATILTCVNYMLACGYSRLPLHPAGSVPRDGARWKAAVFAG